MKYLSTELNKTVNYDDIVYLRELYEVTDKILLGKNTNKELLTLPLNESIMIHSNYNTNRTFLLRNIMAQIGLLGYSVIVLSGSKSTYSIFTYHENFFFLKDNVDPLLRFINNRLEMYTSGKMEDCTSVYLVIEDYNPFLADETLQKVVNYIIKYGEHINIHLLITSESTSTESNLKHTICSNVEKDTNFFYSSADTFTNAELFFIESTQAKDMISKYSCNESHIFTDSTIELEVNLGKCY